MYEEEIKEVLYHHNLQVEHHFLNGTKIPHDGG